MMYYTQEVIVLHLASKEKKKNSYKRQISILSLNSENTVQKATHVNLYLKSLKQL